MTGLLRFEDVVLRRGGRLLFDRLDLTLDAGGALLLTGPNGSGKSSLIRAAAGLLRPEAGRIERAGLAFADEHAAFDGELPLRSALAFWAELAPGRRHDGDGLAAMGLEALKDVPVRLLSAGQRKRAALARVIASGAPLWLLDEPLNGLDSASVALLDRAIADHRAGGGAVLAASHAPLAGDWARLELGAEHRQ